jgi:hypothetical protein
MLRCADWCGHEDRLAAGEVGLGAQCWVAAAVVPRASNPGLSAIDLPAFATKLPVLPKLFGLRRRLHSHTWGTEGPHPDDLATLAV